MKAWHRSTYEDFLGIMRCTNCNQIGFLRLIYLFEVELKNVIF